MASHDFVYACMLSSFLKKYLVLRTEKCCTDANRRLAVRYTLDFIVFLRNLLINRGQLTYYTQVYTAFYDHDTRNT